MADVKAGLPQLRFRLPGTWAQIPLHNSESARAAIKKLVASQLGGRDEAATAREHLRRQFNEALKQAVSGDAQSMQIALEIIEGLPTPVTFTVFLPSQKLTPAIGTSPAAVMAILEQGLVGRPDIDSQSLVKFTTRDSAVLRSNRRESLVVEQGADPISVAIVDYWMTVPGTKRFILINFHTALVEAAVEMMVLFDAIIAAAYWQFPGNDDRLSDGDVQRTR